MESVCVESDLGEEPDLRTGCTDNSGDRGLFLLLPFSRTSVSLLCVGLVESFWRHLFEPHLYRIRSAVGPQGCSREPFIKGILLRVFCRQSFLRMLSRSQSHSGIIFQKNTMTA